MEGDLESGVPDPRIVNPVTWMYSAIEAVGAGKVGEVEGEWMRSTIDGSEVRLTISVRKDIKQYPPLRDL